ncbi:MAG TPA: hypothetical protein VHS97_18305 [Isosphaeraceae bacterium]|nr:hypothetical protein [Isosphaeraceae bacterium]
MDLTTLPLVWAQAQTPPQPAAPNPNSIYFLALRRWCSSLTLSSPQAIPSLHPLWAFVAGLAGLLILAVLAQGPIRVLQQLFDLVGHARLVQKSFRRLWRAGRMVAIAIGFTVLAWTASQAWIFNQESRKADLISLTKSRRLSELALEQGLFASLTPLRDVAGLADNLPLLVIAAIVVFRSSFEIPGWGVPSPGTGTISTQARTRAGWSTLIWGCCSLYALYRIVARMAGSNDLPLGSCLVVEGLIVPLLMVVCDGFLLAWVVVELRNAGFDDTGEDRLDTRQAIALMPAAALVCAFALPARYVATLVLLASSYLPTSASATSLGNYVRWQLGWGLTDVQVVGLIGFGLAGAVAWSRGSIGGAMAGYGRLLAFEGGHVVALAAIAGFASGLLAASAYAVVLLLPAQSWVLAAADSYAHFATLPVGLCALAALIELAERSLPTATLYRSSTRRTAAVTDAQSDRSTHDDALSPVASPII